MSKVVTIPKDRNPFVVIVNGVTYSYTAGEKIEVPDEVADVIEKYESAKPKPAPNKPSGSVQSDWNQTDSSAADFIKNKPFGDVKQEIVPLGDVQFPFDEEEGGCVGILEFPVSLNADDVVEVVWDGTTYLNTALDSGGMGIMFGNLAMLGLENTGEPYIGIDQDGVLVMIDLISTEDATHNVSISAVKKEKIADEYIPFAITIYYCTSTDGGYVYSDKECTVKVTGTEASQSILKGLVTILCPNMVTGIVPYISGPSDGFFAFRAVGADGKTIYYYTAEYPES